MSRPRPHHPMVGAVLAALAAAHLADAWHARRRLAALPILDPAPPDAPPAGLVSIGAAGDRQGGLAAVLAAAGDTPNGVAAAPAAGDPPNGHVAGPAGGDAVGGLVALCAAGVEVPGGVMAAARGFADERRLDVVDLVPGDLGAEGLLALARRTGPDRPAGSEANVAPPTGPSGAGHALLLRPSLASRIGVTTHGGGLGPHALARTTRAAHRAAGDGRATVLAPGLRAGPAGAAGPGRQAAWERLDARTEVGRPYTSPAALVVAGRAAHLLVLAAGLTVSPAAGAAALAAWWAKPALAASGRCADWAAATARRPLLQAAEVANLARTGLATARRRATARAAAPPYAVPPASVRFAPRSRACPWCRSADLRRRLATTDLLQHKPGVFALDECRACGHVFQNPQLTPAGLDFYYNQFYDGIGGELMTQLFATGAGDNGRRIAAVAAAAEATGVDVRRWLDVGTGHGHFPLAARHRWPGAEFHGLDLSEAVEEAAARGWVDRAHRGLFPELAGGLGSYDVVSMHHYLEHARDPVEELDAAAKLLDAGSLLEVEVPDPECVTSRVLGRYWLPWLQPQHLHFVPCANLVAALEERNFEVVSLQRDHQPVELVAALALALEDVLPSAQFPWRPPPSLPRQLARGALLTGAAPAFALAAGLDQVVARALSGRAPTNTYRVVARKA